LLAGGLRVPSVRQVFGSSFTDFGTHVNDLRLLSWQIHPMEKCVSYGATFLHGMHMPVPEQ
jgi:hypothetical protein